MIAGWYAMLRRVGVVM